MLVSHMLNRWYRCPGGTQGLWHRGRLDYAETATSCWYFWGLARNFAVENQSLTIQIRDSQHRIFTEDLEMLESQQARLLENTGRPLMNLNIDRGGMHARKILDELIAGESN